MSGKIATQSIYNASPVLLGLRGRSGLGLSRNVNSRIDKEAKPILIVRTALLMRQQLPVHPGETSGIHVASIGGELGLGVVVVGIDAPFFHKDELVVDLFEPAVVAVCPLVLVGGFGAGVAVDCNGGKLEKIVSIYVKERT